MPTFDIHLFRKIATIILKSVFLCKLMLTHAQMMKTRSFEYSYVPGGVVTSTFTVGPLPMTLAAVTLKTTEQIESLTCNRLGMSSHVSGSRREPSVNKSPCIRPGYSSKL